jgi:uncharacterized membrane protein YfcA
MLGGTLGSFVGIGGGVFTIPIMTSSVFGLTQRQAMATNLVAVMFTGIAGASAYAAASNNNDDVDCAESNASDVIDSRSRDETEKGNDALLNKLQTLFSTANNTDSNVQIDMAITAAVAGMITARLGARISNRLTEKALKRFLAGVMYIAAPAVHLPEFMEKGYNDDEKVEEEPLAVVAVGKENVVASSALKEESSSNKDATKEVQQQQHQLLSEEYVMTRLVPAAMIGSGAGVFSGVTGLGGGIITVSAFALLTPLSYKQALGTSLCAMAFPATSAAIAHHLNGNIVWRVAPFLAAGAACGAFVGGKIGSNLPEKELKYSFSAVMLALGTKVLLRV